MLSRLSSLLRSLANTLQPFAALLSRLVIGWAFFKTGQGKWAHIDKIVAFFADSHIPMPGANARFIATLEIVGGLCLILGLGTRVFAALLSCTMIVALMTADLKSLESAFTGEIGFMDVAPIPFLLVLVWLVAFGPGWISVDRWLEHRKQAGK